MAIKGLKQSSDVITISTGVTESAANTFTQSQVDLNLDPLNNEVFVVLAIDINPTPPDGIAGADTAMRASVSTTTRTALGTLSDPNVLAVSSLFIQGGGFADAGPAFTRLAGETPTAMLDYIGLIATSDFFIQVQGTNNGVAKGANVRVWGYRAKAEAATYAALVQSQVLSA